MSQEVAFSFLTDRKFLANNTSSTPLKLKSSFINQIESTYIIWADFKDQNSYLDLVEYTSKLSKENKSLEFSFTTSDNIYE